MFQENSEKIGSNERYVMYMLMWGRRVHFVRDFFPQNTYALASVSPKKKTEEHAEASEILAWTRSRVDMIFMGRPKVSDPS